MRFTSKHDYANFSKYLNLRIILACFNLYLKRSKIYRNPSGESCLCTKCLLMREFSRYMVSLLVRVNEIRASTNS